MLNLIPLGRELKFKYCVALTVCRYSRHVVLLSSLRRSATNRRFMRSATVNGFTVHFVDESFRIHSPIFLEHTAQLEYWLGSTRLYQVNEHCQCCRWHCGHRVYARQWSFCSFVERINSQRGYFFSWWVFLNTLPFILPRSKLRHCIRQDQYCPVSHPSQRRHVDTWIAFGTCVQIHTFIEPKNSMAPRTDCAIAISTHETRWERWSDTRRSHRHSADSGPYPFSWASQFSEDELFVFNVVDGARRCREV